MQIRYVTINRRKFAAFEIFVHQYIKVCVHNGTVTANEFTTDVRKVSHNLFTFCNKCCSKYFTYNTSDGAKFYHNHAKTTYTCMQKGIKLIITVTK